MWLVMARREQDLIPLLNSQRWRKSRKVTPKGIRTDDYSNLMRQLCWNLVTGISE
jgi:hypothetical protein